MESVTFRDLKVQKAFRRFVEIRLHTDGKGTQFGESSQRNRRLQRDRFGSIASPYYAVLSPDGKTVYWNGGGSKPVEEVLEFLGKVPKP
jgi:thiol:disulfide interchange protein DsbD